MFKNLQAPPLNFPRPAAPASDADESQTSLREGAVLVLSQGRVFQGAITASGQVSVENGRIQFTAAKQPALDIRYRLPGALQSAPQYKGPADLKVIEQSDPGGPDRQVLVSTSGALLFAAVLTKSPRPNRLDIVPGVSVGQVPVDVNEKIRSAASRVEARDASGAVTIIPVGQLTRVRLGGVLLDVFVRASYRIMSGAKEQHEGGYIFEGWAVRSSQP